MYVSGGYPATALTDSPRPTMQPSLPSGGRSSPIPIPQRGRRTLLSGATPTPAPGTSHVSRRRARKPEARCRHSAADRIHAAGRLAPGTAPKTRERNVMRRGGGGGGGGGGPAGRRGCLNSLYRPRTAGAAAQPRTRRRPSRRRPARGRACGVRLSAEQRTRPPGSRSGPPPLLQAHTPPWRQALVGLT